jgi:hypothetical protein
MEKQIYVAESRIMMSKVYAISTWVYLFIPFAIMDKEGLTFADAWPMVVLLLGFILLTNYWFIKVAQQQKTTPFLILRNDEIEIKHPMHKPKTIKYSEIQSVEMTGVNKIKLKAANKRTHKLHRMLIGNDAFDEVWALLKSKTAPLASS